ncbi:MAG: hypothetical protein JWP57_4241 [Spirosoma sp.]|nr:hypothetical protein [Spirosoma sp.]
MNNKPLRIIFLVEFVHEQGTYFRWHNLAIGLQARGHYVTVYGVDWNRHSTSRIEYRDRVEYHILSTFRGLGVFTPSTNPLNFIRRLVVKYPACDIVQTFQPFPFSTYIGWYLKRIGKAKAFCYDWDDLWINGLYKKPLRRLIDIISYPLVHHTEKRFPARADAVMVCSGYLRDLAQSAGSRRVFIVHNGFWSSSPMDKQQARTLLGLRADSVYAGFMGRTLSELSWCLKAMQSLHEQDHGHRVRLALCGMPADALNQLPPNVAAQIDYLGQLSPANCRVFASAIDLGLMPLENNAFNQSRFPIKYAEYQASSTPVLYSQVGECSTIDQHFDWNITAGNTEQQFIDRFISTMLDVLVTSTFSLVKVDRLANFLSWDLLAEQLETNYSSLVIDNLVDKTQGLCKRMSV